MVQIVRYNVLPDRRSWMDKILGVARPVRYSCDVGPEALYEIEEQNRSNQERWGGKIGTVYFPRKNFEP